MAEDTNQPSPANETESAPAAPASGEQAAPQEPKTEDRFEKIVNQIGALFVPVAILASWITAAVYPLVEGNQLDIIAHFTPETIRGRVINKGGEGVGQARVWVILTDSRGNRDSPVAAQTDNNGGFSFSGIPMKLGTEVVAEVTIFAQKEQAAATDEKPRTLRGEEHLLVAGAGTLRRVPFSGWQLLPLPVVFTLGTLLPFFGKPTPWKHVVLVLLSFIFTGTMLVYISAGLSYVNTMGRPGEVLSLGFASIYHGSFVKDEPSEWVFSLTAPPEISPQTPASNLAQEVSPTASSSTSGNPPQVQASIQQPRLAKGFGAPLWVLLVSVLGAAVITVALVVTQIGNRPDPKKEGEMRTRFETIVRHQFYILFAPVGAIFVYQLLVIGEAAAQPMTVALAALGAGASMNALLSKAVEYSTGLIQGFKKAGASRATDES